MYPLTVPCGHRVSTGVDRPTLPGDPAISVPLGIIGFKRLGYTVSVHRGLELAEPDTSPSYLRHLAAKDSIKLSHATNNDQVTALVEASFTIRNAYALGLPMTV
jgi:hypothetical protein